MLIDFHVHSKGISRCCKKDGKDIISDSKMAGIDGIILTNHYDKSYVENNDALAFAKKYINEYYYVKACGEEVEFKVFFGIELTMAKHNDIHMLIYGVSEGFLLKYPDIYDYNIADLQKLVKENDGYLIQAHPYRKGINVLLDLKYLDGIEANCHPKYDGSYVNKLAKLAYDNGLLLTCGGDYHADIYRVRCGVYLPIEIDNTLAAIKYLLASKETKLCIQDSEFEYYDFLFAR